MQIKDILLSFPFLFSGLFFSVGKLEWNWLEIPVAIQKDLILKIVQVLLRKEFTLESLEVYLKTLAKLDYKLSEEPSLEQAIEDGLDRITILSLPSNYKRVSSFKAFQGIPFILQQLKGNDKLLQKVNLVNQKLFQEILNAKDLNYGQIVYIMGEIWKWSKLDKELQEMLLNKGRELQSSFNLLDLSFIFHGLRKMMISHYEAFDPNLKSFVNDLLVCVLKSLPDKSYSPDSSALTDPRLFAQDRFSFILFRYLFSRTVIFINPFLLFSLNYFHFNGKDLKPAVRQELVSKIMEHMLMKECNLTFLDSYIGTLSLLDYHLRDSSSLRNAVIKSLSNVLKAEPSNGKGNPKRFSELLYNVSLLSLSAKDLPEETKTLIYFWIESLSDKFSQRDFKFLLNG